MSTLPALADRSSIYVDGQWVDSSSTLTVEVINPSTEQVIARVPAGCPDDVERVVQAAGAARDSWASSDVATRAKLIDGLLDGLKSRKDALGDTIALEVGTPRKMAGWLQMGLGLMDVETVRRAMDTFEWREQVGPSVVLREAVGVVGAITPWNYPLHQITAKVTAALAAGCTVVLKPSELTPLTAYLFADAVHDAGFPPGVFNMVMGGRAVGEAIVAHPQVDMVSFTGSNAVGRSLLHAVADSVKKVALELGGKSASVVLDDADLDLAVETTVRSCFQNAGQTCTALTRMLVPRARLAEVEQKVAAFASTFRTGDPFVPASTLGPMVSSTHLARVRSYIESGEAEGARLLCGGSEPAGLPETGWFVAPTVFTDVRPDMRIAQEEIFGPVLSILAYDDEDEAVSIANGTIYGLSSSVFAGSDERAETIARRMRSGQVNINGGGFNPLAPFGGYKQSGLGREGGRFGIDEFVEVKSMQYPAKR